MTEIETTKSLWKPYRCPPTPPLALGPPSQTATGKRKFSIDSDDASHESERENKKASRLNSDCEGTRVEPQSPPKAPPRKASLSKRDAQWEEQFLLLCEFKRKYRTTRVHKSDSKLFGWIHTQRTKHKQRKLSEYRFQRLESLGFDWHILQASPWMEMYNQLLVYKKEHNGSTCVSKTSLHHDKLGRWVYQQRSMHRTGKLAPDRFKLLEAIDFQWRVVDETPWMDMYQRLLDYKEKHGTTCVPYKYELDRKLGRWVYNQRRSCEQPELVDLLNGIGFVWDARGRNQFSLS